MFLPAVFTWKKVFKVRGGSDTIRQQRPREDAFSIQWFFWIFQIAL